MSIALIISNQYEQFPDARLYGCHNDANNFLDRLLKIEPNIKIIRMRDDLPTKHALYPTKNNILRELINMCKSKTTTLYFYYSGHGTSVTDYNKDENTINFNSAGRQITSIQSLLQDSCLVSNDITNLNIVVDDEISLILGVLNSNQTLYGFLDSCNSGTGFDLCYVNLGKYDIDFNSTTLSGLLLESAKKCSLISSNYPNKVNQIKGNVILFSGTRDKDYSYEGNINGNIGGYFTNVLCWLLDNNISFMSIKQFYYCLIGILNIQLPPKVLAESGLPPQVPVLTCSKNVNLDTTKLTRFKYIRPNIKPLNSIIIPNLKNYGVIAENQPLPSKYLTIYYLKRQHK
jgi:hypothetical protein